MKKDSYILVVGGAGYIGSHVNKALAEKGYRTLVLDNLSYGHLDFLKWGEFVLGDLSDRDFLSLLFRKYPIAAVMHFAAFAYVGESVTQPDRYYRNNVVNTLNLLETMCQHGVSHMIFSSSCATYGMPLTIPIPEDHPRAPINPYGRTKLMVEQMLADFAHAFDLRYVALRYFNAAGADPEGEIGEWHTPETHLIPLVLDVAIGRRPDIHIFGTDYGTPDGTCIRDYIHVSDLADAHVAALGYLLSGGQSQSLNLGNGNGFSVKDVIACAEEITGMPIQAIESPRRPGDPPRLVGASQKASEVLGWTPRYTALSEIVKTAWKWHRLLPQE